MERLKDAGDRAAKSPSIDGEHGKKLAVVYVRTATVGLAAAAEQRALTALPREWGWPERLIKIIDADIGRAGLSAHRAGFQRLMELMDRGRVGLVIARDVSRLSRDPCDLERFVGKAIQRGVVIAAGGLLIVPPPSGISEGGLFTRGRL